jgi:hypothetical protein
MTLLAKRSPGNSAQVFGRYRSGRAHAGIAAKGTAVMEPLCYALRTLRESSARYQRHPCTEKKGRPIMELFLGSY